MYLLMIVCIVVMCCEKSDCWLAFLSLQWLEAEELHRTYTCGCVRHEVQDLLSAQDQLGNTALHTGVMTGNLEVVEKLIASCKAGGRALNACNADGASALILACKSASSSEGDDDLEKIAIALGIGLSLNAESAHVALGGCVHAN